MGEVCMDKEEFIYFRKELGKTQREMAELLGSSLKAVHSYEQGWRSVSVSAERQILFLYSLNLEKTHKLNQCWKIRKCPPEFKARCPAWEFRSGKLCWFINGTVCEGTVQRDWSKKMQICRKCEVFAPLLPPQRRRRK
jgi:DNA-binding XRE family transcriptional regulator